MTNDRATIETLLAAWELNIDVEACRNNADAACRVRSGQAIQDGSVRASETEGCKTMTNDRATIELSRLELNTLIAAWEFNTDRHGDNGPLLTKIFNVLRSKLADAPNKEKLIAIDGSVAGWSELAGFCSHVPSCCVIGHSLVTRLSGGTK